VGRASLDGQTQAKQARPASLDSADLDTARHGPVAITPTERVTAGAAAASCVAITPDSAPDLAFNPAFDLASDPGSKPSSKPTPKPAAAAPSKPSGTQSAASSGTQSAASAALEAPKPGPVAKQTSKPHTARKQQPRTSPWSPLLGAVRRRLTAARIAARAAATGAGGVAADASRGTLRRARKRWASDTALRRLVVILVLQLLCLWLALSWAGRPKSRKLRRGPLATWGVMALLVWIDAPIWPALIHQCRRRAGGWLQRRRSGVQTPLEVS